VSTSRSRSGPSGGGAAGGGNERMPVPSGRLEDLMEGSAGHCSSRPWPVLEEVTIGWRGA
jgi:hypothetical protein